MSNLQKSLTWNHDEKTELEIRVKHVTKFKIEKSSVRHMTQRQINMVWNIMGGYHCMDDQPQAA